MDALAEFAGYKNVEREMHIVYSRVALQTKRYEDLLNSIKVVCTRHSILSSDERQLLAESHKQILSAHRSSRDFILETEEHLIISGLLSDSELQHLIFLREYRQKVETDIRRICLEFIDIIDTYHISQSYPHETIVSLYRMKGDCYRYLAEIRSGHARERAAADQSREAYQVAKELADEHLPAAHPEFFLVALSFSLLYHVIFKDDQKACNIAKSAIDLASEEVNLCPDSNAAMVEIRKNFTEWSQ